MATPQTEVKRDYEATLDSYLSDLKEGKGRAIRYDIDAGADAFPVEYIKGKAKENGYNIFEGNADAIRPGSVFERILPEEYAAKVKIQQPAKVLYTFLSRKDGIQVAEAGSPQGGLDPEIFAGMMTALENFFDDSMSQMKLETGSADVKKHSVGEYTLLLKPGKYTTAVTLIKGKETDELIADISNALYEAEEKYGKALENWHGNIDETKGMAEPFKRALFESGKYTGEIDIEAIGRKREAQKDAILQGLEKLSAEKPTVVFVNNLENIGEADAEALKYIGRNIGKSKLMIVGTNYEDKLSESKNEYAAGLKDGYETFELAAPENLEQILAERLTGLNPAAVKFLEIAAIAGNVSDKRVLRKAAEASGINADDIMEATSQLAAAGLLKDWKPANAKIARKALENAKSAEDYVAVADAVVELYGNEKSYSAAIAGLYGKAGSKEKTTKFAKIAAEYAKQNGNLSETIQHYRTATEYGVDEDKLESLEKIVELGWVGGKDLQEVLTDAEQLEKLALEKNDMAKAYAAVLHKARVFTSVGKIGEALMAIKHAEELSRILDQEEKSEIEMIRGIIAGRQKDYDSAITHYGKALEIAEKTDDKKTKFRALFNTAFAYQKKKEFERSLEYYSKASLFARDLGKASEVALFDNLASVCWYLQKYGEGELYAKKALKICESEGILNKQPSLYLTLGANALAKKDFENAIKHENSALKIAQRIDSRYKGQAEDDLAEAKGKDGINDLQKKGLPREEIEKRLMKWVSEMYETPKEN